MWAAALHPRLLAAAGGLRGAATTKLTAGLSAGLSALGW